MGFDLKNEPKIFPEIWTGDETRYASTTDQQLRPYESYEIFRYFENIAPGRNGGGWVDPIAAQYLDRYAGQLWDTILAKAPAINLFQYTDLLTIADPRNRDAWERLPTTFNYFDMARQCCGGVPGMPGASYPLLADAVEYALRKVDAVAGSLGQPVGLATYRPYDSTGEDFLPETAGMVGIPVEMYPQWPACEDGLPDAGGRHGPQHRFGDRAAPARRRQRHHHLGTPARDPGQGLRPGHRHARDSRCRAGHGVRRGIRFRRGDGARSFEADSVPAHPLLHQRGVGGAARDREPGGRAASADGSLRQGRAVCRLRCRRR